MKSVTCVQSGAVHSIPVRKYLHRTKHIPLWHQFTAMSALARHSRTICFAALVALQSRSWPRLYFRHAILMSFLVLNHVAPVVVT